MNTIRIEGINQILSKHSYAFRIFHARNGDANVDPLEKVRSQALLSRNFVENNDWEKVVDHALREFDLGSDLGVLVDGHMFSKARILNKDFFTFKPSKVENVPMKHFHTNDRGDLRNKLIRMYQALTPSTDSVWCMNYDTWDLITSILRNGRDYLINYDPRSNTVGNLLGFDVCIVPQMDGFYPDESPTDYRIPVILGNLKSIDMVTDSYIDYEFSDEGVPDNMITVIVEVQIGTWNSAPAKHQFYCLMSDWDYGIWQNIKRSICPRG